MRNYVLLIFFLSLNAQAIPPLPGKSLVVKDLFAVLQDILGGSVKEKNISGKTKDGSTCIVWLNLQLRPGWGRNWYQMEFAVAPGSQGRRVMYRPAEWQEYTDGNGQFDNNSVDYLGEYLFYSYEKLWQQGIWANRRLNLLSEGSGQNRTLTVQTTLLTETSVRCKIPFPVL